MGIAISPIIDLSGPAKTLFYIMLIPLGLFSLRFYVLGTLGPLLNRARKRYADVPEKDLPSVSVHIPVYNDKVVKSCIDHCLKFDYPKDRYEILVADDSDDETARVLDGYRGNGMVKVVRRNNRKGFKAGAMNGLLPYTKGDIVVVFDSDYTPAPDFLRKIVRPFHTDDKMAYVQSRWGYVNPSDNTISRVASMCFNAFHKCCMPVHNKIGSAIFCGTGGAVRKDVLQEIGGWNENSVSEDLDASIRILAKGYRQEYLPDLIAAGEVPTTMKSFVKQQQRWAYGTTTAMLDHMDRIASSKRMSFMQKLDLSVLLPGFLIFPFILGVFLSSAVASTPLLGPSEFTIPTNALELGVTIHKTVAPFFSREGLYIFAATSGFLYTVVVGLLIDRRYRDLLYVPLIYAVGLVIQVTNTVSVAKAVLGIPVTFYRTPKKLVA